MKFEDEPQLAPGPDIPGLSFTIYLSIISICTQCSYMQQSKGVYYKEIAWIHAMKN